MSAPQKGVVSACSDCRFAQWNQTANGRRHPNGAGLCAWQAPDVPAPKWLHVRYAQAQSVRAYVNHGQHRQIFYRDTWHTEPEPCPAKERAS